MTDPASLHDADQRAADQAIADGLVPLHAAALEDVGRVVALAGPSGSGKSTLAAAAVLDGVAFVADEITAVSALDLGVRVFHRPIGLRQGAADALGVDFPDDRRSIPGAVHPLPVDTARLSPGGTLHAVAIVRWDPAATPSLQTLPPAQALAELSQHVVVDDEAIPDTFRRLDLLVRTVGVVRLDFPDPPSGVRLVRTLLAP